MIPRTQHRKAVIPAPRRPEPPQIRSLCRVRHFTDGRVGTVLHRRTHCGRNGAVVRWDNDPHKRDVWMPLDQLVALPRPVRR